MSKLKVARDVVVIVGVGAVAAAVAWFVFIFEPVKTKYMEASEAVVSDVTFGGGSSPALLRRPAREAPAREEPVKADLPELTRSSNPNHKGADPEASSGAEEPAPTGPSTASLQREEVVNYLRQTRRYRKVRRNKKAPSKGAVIERLGPPSVVESASTSTKAPDPKPQIRPAPALKPGELAPVVRREARFAPGEVNPMTRVSEDALSTFSIDVDTGSYTLNRRMINEGYRVVPERVRVEEFLNYFNYAYPEPPEGAFGVSLDVAPSPFKPAAERKILRVGVQGRRLTPDMRKPVHLTFLVDVSGSMQGDHRIGLAKESLRILTWNLGAGDTVAISTYAGKVETILEPTGMLHRNEILAAIDALETSGTTRMGDGLDLAYQSAMHSFVPGDVNRVIVLSDGDANLGPMSFTRMFERIQKYVDHGITLTTIGFGMGNYREEMMEQLANKGNGNYFYIDSKKEAVKIFEEELDATLQVIAKDVKIQVEFDPKAVHSYRLIGYENRDIADKDFRDDRVDAGEIGAGHSVTALYELVLTEAAARDKAVADLATVRIRAKTPGGTQAAEQAFPLSTRDLHPALSAAGPDFQFAVAVAGFAEILRKSPYAEDTPLALIEELARAASTPEQARRQEFIDLVTQMKERQKHERERE